jgi:hypothetical protein
MSATTAVPPPSTGRNDDPQSGPTIGIADYYRNIDLGIERQVGAWRCTDGVEFVDRLRHSDGYWEGYWEVARVEAPGYFHFFVQVESHNVNEELNGVLLRRGVRPAGTVRVPSRRTRYAVRGSVPSAAFRFRSLAGRYGIAQLSLVCNPAGWSCVTWSRAWTLR